MATEYAKTCVSKAAGADLSTAQFKIVVLGTDERVTVAGTAGVSAFGVLQNNPAINVPAAVAISGQTKIALGATLAAGAKFTTSNAGLAVAPTTGQAVLGTITEGGANGQIGSAVFDHEGASA